MFERIYDKLIMKLLAPTTQRLLKRELQTQIEKYTKEIVASLADNKIRNLEPRVLEILIVTNDKLDLNVKARLLDAMRPRETMHFG